jgi:hypothetical protein
VIVSDSDLICHASHRVQVDMVMKVMANNSTNVKKLWLAAIPAIAQNASKEAVDAKATAASSNIMGGH